MITFENILSELARLRDREIEAANRTYQRLLKEIEADIEGGETGEDLDVVDLEDAWASTIEDVWHEMGRDA